MEERKLSYRNDDAYTDYAVEIVLARPKALLVRFLDKEEKWIPKSVCQNSEHRLDEMMAGDMVELRIADWFAKKEGFLA